MATLTIADLDNGKRDLETVDAVANSPADTTTTRYGDSVLTLAGALRRLGYQAPVVYAPSLAVDTGLFTVSKDGVIYAPNPELVPFTTGAWDPSQWRVVQNTAGANLVYQFATLGGAQAAAATLPSGAQMSVDGESTGKALFGAYAIESGVPTPTVSNYSQLMTYKGKSNSVSVTGILGTTKSEGISGLFVRTNRAGAVTNGGTVFKLDNGDVFERVYTGSIHASWFEAKLDGVTPDHVAVQKAIDACKAAGWASLCIDGPARISSSLIVDRLVDQNKNEWNVFGLGKEAGFLVDSGVTLFDSSIAMPSKDPVSEFITFNDLNFSAAAYMDEAFVLSKKFLRIKFNNCFFWLLRCQNSTTSYCQTLYFNGCNIRNNRPGFIDTKGLYDVVFTDCVIENGNTIVKCVDTATGCSGLRFIACVIEGIQTSTVVATGVAGFCLIGCHIEANRANDYNLWGGTLLNTSITVTGNYIYAPNGAVFYHGTATKLISTGNTCIGGGNLHDGVARVEHAVIADAATIADTVLPTFDTGALKIFTNGSVGIGINQVQGVKLVTMAKSGQTGIAEFLNPSGLTALKLDINRNVILPGIQAAASDSAAATAGVPVGGLYHNGGALRIRIA